jgi:hypothetical protein
MMPERDCTEGCADDGHTHKWEITPHPYSSDLDVFVTDSDNDARGAIEDAAEQAWDQCGDGMTRTITIRRRAVKETKAAPERDPYADINNQY